MPRCNDVLVPEDEAATRASIPRDVGVLYEQCRGYLLAIAKARLHPQVRQQIAPSDVVQETFCKVQAKFGQFRGTSQEEVRAWLRSILRNLIAEIHRRLLDTEKHRVTREVSMDQPEVMQELVAGAASPSSIVARQEHEELTIQAMERLPPDYRRVIELRSFEDLDFAAIGDQLGRSATAARQLWVRAIQRLSSVRESLHVVVPRPDSPGG